MFAANTRATLFALLLLPLWLRQVQSKLRMFIGSGNMHRHDLSFLFFLEEGVYSLHTRMRPCRSIL